MNYPTTNLYVGGAEVPVACDGYSAAQLREEIRACEADNRMWLALKNVHGAITCYVRVADINIIEKGASR